MAADESKGGESKDDVSFSSGGKAVWTAAFAEARKRGHGMVGSEHLLWALMSAEPAPAATRWLLRFAKKDDIVASLNRFEPFVAAASGASAASATIETSPRVDMILDSARRIADAVQGGFVTSDGILIGILLDGRNTAAAIVENASRGRASKHAALKALGMDVSAVVAQHERIRTRKQPWEHYTVTAAGGVKGAPTTPYTSNAKVEVPAVPPLSDMAKVERMMTGPTNASNWLVPGAVLMGAMPQSSSDVRRILDAGVTTIVPLVEEISLRRDYPRHIVSYLRAQADGAERTVELLHFPIEDFECVDEPKHLVVLVEELTARVQHGQVLYVHCLGGHGRTGTVVISLLAALTGMSNADARKYVVAYHNQRVRCRHSTWCHLPEVESQEAQIAAVNPAMRRHHKKAALKK